MKSIKCGVLVSMASLLAACGGGGGDSGQGAAPTPTPTPTPAPTPTVVISGTVSFDYVPILPGSMGLPRLDYSAIGSRPARRVALQVIDAQSDVALATVSTGDDGRYSVSVPARTMVFLRMRAEMVESGTPSWDFRVVDNTQDDALYVTDGADFGTGDSDSIRDLHAGSGWTGLAYTEPRAAAPFAILDAVRDGMELVLSVMPDASFPATRVHWSPENRTSLGENGLPDPDSGQIGSSFFAPGLGGIFLLGQQDDDTEEYDRGVVLHEWAHYLERAFMRSDSIGGPHTIGDRLDMRVAFGEGFASAFAAMVLGEGRVFDTFGPRQEQGFTIGVESTTGLNPGWFSEESVQAIVYDLFDADQDTVQDQLAIGFGPIFDVLSNDVRDSVALTSLFPFVHALKQLLGAGDAALIDDLLASHAIATVTDEFGTGRANPPLPAGGDVLPIYSDLTVNGGPVEVCSTDDFGSSFGSIESVNKLGSRRFLRFTADTAADHSFSATSTVVPAGETSDPDMELHQRGPLLPFSLGESPGKSGDPDAETFVWPLLPGEYVLEIYEWTNTKPRDDPEFSPIGRTCFDVEVTTP